MGNIYDPNGMIIGTSPGPDVLAPPQQAPAPAPPMPPAGVGGAAGWSPPPAPPPASNAPMGVGTQPNRVLQTVTPEQLAEAERRRQAELAASQRPKPGPPAVAVAARQPPGGDATRPIGYTPYTPAHFEQAGNFYRGTPEQSEAIKGVLGANAHQIQVQQDASAQQLQAEQRLMSAQDIEAVKARKANQQQAVIEQMQAADREEAHQAVREAIDTHAKMAAPDPAEYWRGLGFGGSIMMILADSMQRLGSGMKREPPANLVEKGIERSLKTQQAAIDKSAENIKQAQGLYAQMRQSGLDQQQAFQAAKARRLEDAAGIIDSYQRQVKLPQLQAALAAQSDELKKRAGYEYLQLSESIAGQGKGRMAAATGGAPIYPGGDLKQRKALAEVLKAEAEATQAGRKASGEESELSFNERHKLQKELTELEISAEKLEKAKAALPSKAQVIGDELSEWLHLPFWMPRSTPEQIAKKEETKMAIGSLEPGTKTELDMARYAKQAGHTGAETYSQEAAAKLHDEMKQRIQNRAAAVRAALGVSDVGKTESRKRQELARDALRGK